MNYLRVNKMSTAEFKRAPETFLKTNLIMVPEETDKVGSDGVHSFTLKNIPDRKAAFTLEASESGDSIKAYYLPWKKDLAVTMTLGADADFFFHL